MLNAIIFDMDGVLIDSEPVYLRDTYIFLRNHGIQVKYKDLFPLVGADSRMFWQILANKWETPITADEVNTLYNKEVREFNYDHILNPHVKLLLPILKEKGFKIGLASSSPLENIKTVLDDCQIRNYFDCIKSGEMFKQSKPNPEIYCSTMESLQTNASMCIAIEDSQIGIRAAKAAGMYVVAKEERRFGFNQDEADTIIVDLLEILDVIESKTTTM
ncbi:MAG: HAD family hydrolase [Erysipelotrichia bacterium]|nr:HAD family hydrolase [Erysipelotrichia bacterium]NCC54939.1 HAD family hydrolase [Erysipelotrichia bacterium]